MTIETQVDTTSYVTHVENILSHRSHKDRPKLRESNLSLSERVLAEYFLTNLDEDVILKQFVHKENNTFENIRRLIFMDVSKMRSIEEIVEEIAFKGFDERSVEEHRPFQVTPRSKYDSNPMDEMAARLYVNLIQDRAVLREIPSARSIDRLRHLVFLDVLLQSPLTEGYRYASSDGSIYGRITKACEINVLRNFTTSAKAKVNTLIPASRGYSDTIKLEIIALQERAYQYHNIFAKERPAYFQPYIEEAQRAMQMIYAGLMQTASETRKQLKHEEHMKDSIGFLQMLRLITIPFYWIHFKKHWKRNNEIMDESYSLYCQRKDLKKFTATSISQFNLYFRYNTEGETNARR